MKKLSPVAVVFAGLFFICFVIISCGKPVDTSNIPKSQLIVGRWNINRIQLRLYYGGVFIKDTIIPQTPMPENFVQFDASGNFQYRFNTPTIDAGTYQIISADSVISNASSKIYRWKMLTLTDVLFTVMNTSSADPVYPGATVETYQTLVK